MKNKTKTVGILAGITEKDKFVKCGVSSTMIVSTLAQLLELLRSDFNG